MKPTVTKKAFLDFFFSDNYDKKNYGIDLVNELIKKGTITVTIEDVYKDVGYIPANICENLTKEQKQDDDLEFDPSEVTLID